jgi:serine protease Do
VTLPDGRRLAARTVARDPARDLALLQLDVGALPPGALTPAPPGDPARLRPGEIVLALGHPLGHANALAAGIVHAAGAAAPPAWLRARGAARPVRVVRADVRLLPGNSGGPLADATGRVVGINTMVVGGLGVAVSVAEVVELVAALERGAARAA